MKVPSAALVLALDAARTIRDVEKAALQALHEGNDEASYRAGMLEKCRLLSGLPEAVSDFLMDADGPEAEAFATGLEDFARKAAQAMSLNSVFYMSALLYPEEYADGDPNDLEAFLARFTE